MKLIVTAGGQGKKIWPLSRETKPKQFQAVVGEKPLYQRTVENLLKAYKPQDIYISTKKKYMELARAQSSDIPMDNYIIEPDVARDRGPGEGLAFLTLAMKHPDEPFMIVQSDVLREPGEKFLETIAEAEKIERRDKKFMSGGVKATYPMLGVDYLRLGSRVHTNDIDIFETEEFIPRLEDYNKTKDLIKSFHIATHCNHMCWFPELMLEAYSKFRPDWYEALMKIKDLLGKSDSEKKIEEIYAGMESGATELVTNHIVKGSYTILLPFKWTDIGTWDSVYEFFDTDGQVYIDGTGFSIDSDTSLIKNEQTKKVIVTVGVHNLVIIDTKDALLVCAKDKTGDVKRVVEELKAKKLDQYT